MISTRLRISCAGLLMWAVLAAAGAGSASAASVSSNWAGYVALPSKATRAFSSTSGTWTEPAISCRAGRETFSAVWAGLGGYDESSDALEQIGTEANCSLSGRSSYAAWWEIIPAAPVKIALAVHPGDQITASVTVRSHDVTLAVRDLSTGARFATTRHASNIDVSSAEWIVEAPSVCGSATSCETLPLSDFGSVQFASASATAAGHTGSIVNRSWSSLAMELRQASFSRGRRFGRPQSLTIASPSSLSSAGGAFSVAFTESSSQAVPELPTLPSLDLAGR
jgi:hypothetical protein